MTSRLGGEDPEEFVTTVNKPKHKSMTGGGQEVKKISKST